jgi:predicted nucleic-acid-binding protein
MNKDYEDFSDEISVTRGQIINRTVILETAMSVFLAKHFCKTKELRIEIIETIFQTQKFTFDNKRDTMNAIINLHYADFSKDNPSFNKDIQYIAEQRNIFAHYPNRDSKSDIERYKNEQIFVLIKYKNATTFEEYDFAKIESLCQLINKTNGLLVDLIDSIT